MTLSLQRFSACLIAVFMFFVRTARADIMQPDGTLIPAAINGYPCHSIPSNVGACLDDGEVAIGGRAGSISAVHDATIVQETFDPGCRLTFKVISYGTSQFDHVFGWYEARPGNTPPALTDLHPFLDCTETKTIGLTKTLTVPPGTGKIGFFTTSGDSCPTIRNGVITSEPMFTSYTERRYNGLLRNGNPDPNSMSDYVHVLTYQSVAQPLSFYFAWEDDPRPGSDYNFEDLVTWVSGIQCSSGGEACDTGLKGYCAMGTKQCRGGKLTCVGDRMPGVEKCNGLDDNCDGVVDEGNPCDPGFVCFRGNCVPNCARGEFSCGGGTACEADAGVCVDTRCLGVTCPAGEVCRGGTCVGECVGVQCPFGQACRLGGCVDVCATQTCDMGFSCVPTYTNGADKDPVGLCTSCACGCATGTKCVAQHCVPDDCANVTCSANTHCVGGACVDNCAGAVCPIAQKCEAGRCVADPNAVKDGGVDASSPPKITTSTTTTGSGPDAGGGGASGAGGAADGSHRGSPSGSSSCGCRTPRGDFAGSMAGMIALALALAFARRRAR